MSIRKVVCVQYPTGKSVKKKGKTYPETKLRTPDLPETHLIPISG